MKIEKINRDVLELFACWIFDERICWNLEARLGNVLWTFLDDRIRSLRTFVSNFFRPRKLEIRKFSKFEFENSNLNSSFRRTFRASEHYLSNFIFSELLSRRSRRPLKKPSIRHRTRTFGHSNAHGHSNSKGFPFF